jgi:hypothetical protein
MYRRKSRKYFHSLDKLSAIPCVDLPQTSGISWISGQMGPLGPSSMLDEITVASLYVLAMLARARTFCLKSATCNTAHSVQQIARTVLSRTPCCYIATTVAWPCSAVHTLAGRYCTLILCPPLYMFRKCFRKPCLISRW